MKLFYGLVVLLLSWNVLAARYSMPDYGNDIVGKDYTITVGRGDSLTTIREDNDISYEELLESNPKINFYKLRVGQRLIIPKQFILPKFRTGIVINIAELRLYYFTPDGRDVYTFPVGLGRTGWRTPLISAKVIKKEEDPIWNVPDDIRNYIFQKTGKLIEKIIYPGPDNPLGKYALRLSVSGYLIHGTNAPTSVGTFISSGCMRLNADAIELLYNKVPVGTSVRTIHQPNKVGWYNNRLYLESQDQVNSYARQPESELNEIHVRDEIDNATRLRKASINWDAVSYITKESTGIVQQIGIGANFN